MKRWFLLSILAVGFMPLGHATPTWCGYSYNQQTRTNNYADMEIGLVPSTPTATIQFTDINWGDSLAEFTMDTGTINGFSCYNPPGYVEYFHALHSYTANGTYTVTAYYGENLVSEGSVTWVWTITLTTTPSNNSPSGGGLARPAVKL